MSVITLDLTQLRIFILKIHLSSVVAIKWHNTSVEVAGHIIYKKKQI